MGNHEYLKWIEPSIPNRSVKIEENKFNFRLEKAKQQLTLITVSKDRIIDHVNNFFRIMDMETVDKSKAKVKPIKRATRRIAYAKINPDNKNNIVWIKFSIIKGKEDIISVIGTGCDIFFSEHCKKNSSAGIINQRLGMEWNEDCVLIFPLKKIRKGLNNSDIESGIGNYLISKGVPILDFYSHNYS